MKPTRRSLKLVGVTNLTATNKQLTAISISDLRSEYQMFVIVIVTHISSRIAFIQI